MRDIVLVIGVFVALCYGLTRPWVGIAVWTFISLLNPHRYSWTFAYSLPFGVAAAAVTMLAMFTSKEPKRTPTNGPAITLMLFIVWVGITTVFAFSPSGSTEMLSKVFKIYLMTILAMSVIVTERHIKIMMWVMTLSIGFLSAKGGFFTLITGGSYRVWGPPESFIEDNNSFAVAAIMVIPMLSFLSTQVSKRWQKWGLLAAMPLSLLCALGSHSRGGLLAIVGMLTFFVYKSKNKFLLIVLIIAATPFVINFLPDEWFARMETIKTYNEDESAMGRINAWHMAWNLATSRITGGGFEIYNPVVFNLYAPNPSDVHAAHSIYFQILGEHGFIGLFLFLALWLQTWLSANWIIRNIGTQPGKEWMGNLARMIQVSQIGYLVGGAFLSLAYWDMPYYQMVLIVALRRLIEESQGSKMAAFRQTKSLGPQPTATNST